MRDAANPPKTSEAVKNITRGGQTFLHNFRMINQVLNKVLLWTLPVALIIAWGWFKVTTQPYQRYLGQTWVSAQWSGWLDGAQHKQTVVQPDGSAISVTANQIISSPVIHQTAEQLIIQLIHALEVGLLCYGITVGVTLGWLKRRGDLQSKPKHIKGDYLGDVSVVKKIMKEKSLLSTLMLGQEQLPLPLYSEMQHFLFHGTTGSGKSTSIKEFLDLIRARGERAIIYDKSCNLVKQFFSADTDFLLNPLDERGVVWSLWKECRDKADFESYAAAQIPMPLSTQDPFWINAARTIFAASAFRMKREENPKILTLLRNLLTADINELQTLLKGTEAESLMSEKTEKTAISIKSVLATYLKSLCFLKDGEDPFSIRQWIQNDKEKSWLFISSLGDKHESLKPLITAWLDIAVNALLSLPENPQRRIWIILDELTSLHQLPYLTTALSEARKFGGCFVIGIQSYAQLTKVYGNSGAQEISSLLNTRFMFRLPDPDIARWSSQNLGEETIEEVREGISYGANTMRDGVSVNRVETKKPVVNYSEFMNLDELCCFVRLAGPYPITKLHIPYLKRDDKNLAFIAREAGEADLRGEVFQLAEKLSAPVENTKPTQVAAAPTDSETPVKKVKIKKTKTAEPKPIINKGPVEFYSD